MAVLPRLEPGAVFARDYRVVRPLSEGGMGAVYVAEQISTGKQRALKIMHPQLVQDARQRERFAQEARVGSLIASEHAVEVVGAGVDETSQTPWLAMELLEGEDLAGLLRRRGALPPAEVSEILAQLCEALAAAHARGVVHRDLKPENVFISTSRRRGLPFLVKVLDFGIAKVVAENRTSATATTAIGSPLWMAPEQATTGSQLRPATDVWALGLLAFNLLTGKNYWPAANAQDFNLSALLVEVMVHPIERASVRAAALGCTSPLPSDFDGWFAHCVVRAPEARFPEAGAAMAALGPVLAERASAVPFAVTRPQGVVAAASLPVPGAWAQHGQGMSGSQVPGTPSTVAWTPGSLPAGLVAIPSTAEVQRPKGSMVPFLAVSAGVLVAGGVTLALVMTSSRESSGPRTEQATPFLAEQHQRPQTAASIVPDAGAPGASAEGPDAGDLAVFGTGMGGAGTGGGTIGLGSIGTIGHGAGTGTGQGYGTGAGRGLRALGTRGPTIRAAQPAITGHLDPAAIRRVVLRNLGQVNHCYERGLASDPTQSGRATVRFVIGATGDVMASSAADCTVSNAVCMCIAMAVRRWRFPAPEGGGIVTVNYPFNLQAATR